MDDIKLSIIIPIYNMESYIERCLDSVLSQSIFEIEVICINDGSSDNTKKILEKYVEKDDRVKLIDKDKNEGLVAARQSGVCVAKGKYIGFVDGDDWVERDMFENLYRCAQQYEADLVTSGYFYEGAYITEHIDSVETKLYTGKEMSYIREKTILDLQNRDVGIRTSLCCKLFERERLKKAQLVVPQVITISEDKACLLAFMLTAERVYVLHKSFYHYIKNTNSMVNTKDYDYLSKVQNIYSFFRQLYRHPNFTDTMKLQAEIYIIDMLLKGINFRMGFTNNKMLWVDPYWLDKIPLNAKVVIYGAGELGETYRKQLKSRPDIKYIGYMDFDMKSDNGNMGKRIEPLYSQEISFDTIVISIKNEIKALEIKNKLTHMFPNKSIEWFRQEELYWKFLDAQGLI